MTIDTSAGDEVAGEEEAGGLARSPDPFQLSQALDHGLRHLAAAAAAAQHRQWLHRHRLPHRLQPSEQRHPVRQGRADPDRRHRGRGYTAQIVFASTDFTDDATRQKIKVLMEPLFAEVDKIDGVKVTSPYTEDGNDFSSYLGGTSFAQISYTPRSEAGTRRPCGQDQTPRRHDGSAGGSEHPLRSQPIARHVCLAHRVRRTTVRRLPSARSRDPRTARRDHHSPHRLRFGDRDGPPDHDGVVRSRCRLGGDGPRLERIHDPRVRSGGRRDDRPRCGHRLRAVHRHQISRTAPWRHGARSSGHPCRRLVGPGRDLRRAHRDDLDARALHHQPVVRPRPRRPPRRSPC